MNKPNTFATLSTADLAATHGGAEPPASYNASDLKNAASGASLGGRVAGLPGAVIGGGAGFMARNVGELGKGLWSLGSEWNRGRQLDAQLKARQGK